MNIINPATEEIITSLTVDDAETLKAKHTRLGKGQLAWSQVPLDHRISIVEQFAVLLNQESEALADTLTAETGKPVWQSRNEIKGAINRISWLCSNASNYLSDELMGSGEEVISYEPLGTVCNISAWNYPYLVGVNVFVPALLAGNAVLYKPSEHAALTGLHIERLLKQAGVPDDVFQAGIGAADAGKALLALPFDGYFFTGSYATGKYIYEQVSPRWVPCQLELGGKDPVYVTDGQEDIESVAAATADGAFYNNGQSCCSVERIYVHEQVYDAYVNAFIAQVKAWKTGDPHDDDTYFGPLSRGGQREVLESQIEDAVSKGAKVVIGGKRVGGKGYYFEPTVLTEVDHRMAVMREESFGPVIGIMKVRNDEDALALMQDTGYGLTAGVYSPDRERALSILKRIDAGTGYWNCCDRVSPALPWSGRRHSGIGMTLSHQGLRAFTKPKALHLKG
ncbi:aldehyde dehydrogenase family protein [Parapedobacter sp. DT-150]|uniref:aldehyde dehydrogenase family protein n=1 Tax=Parapedobacter sp. DT-150 TaxID=3396162 RepID=UPI003F19DAC3